MTTLQEKLESLRAKLKTRSPEPATPDEAYDKLRVNYPALYQYIRFESPVPFCPIETLRSANLLGVEYTRRKFAERLARDVQTLYGEGYPR